MLHSIWPSKNSDYSKIESTSKTPIPKEFSINVFVGDIARERIAEIEGGFFLELQNCTFKDGDEKKIFIPAELKETKYLTFHHYEDSPVPIIKAAYVKNPLYNPEKLKDSDLKDPNTHHFDLSSAMPLVVCFVSSSYDNWVRFLRNDQAEESGNET